MSNDYNGKKRSELPDSVFGIPQERKYPMPDEKHTRSAIKLFNHVDPKYEEQLAKAVIKNMKKYGIDGSVVGPNNRLRKYLPKDMIKELSMLEGFLKSDKDIYYNKDKFDSGEINLCFITGLIGSGKTTMSKEISSKNIECYEIDDVIFNYCLSDDDLKDKKLLYLFFNGIGKKYRYRYKDNEYNHNLYYSFENYEKDITIDFVKYSIEYASSYTNKIVIDGIWIYLYIEPKLLSDYAVYIKGTSMVKSSYRATNRGIQNKIDKGTDLTPADIAKKYIFRIKKDFKFGKMHMQKLKSFRSYFEKQSTDESYVEESSNNKVYHLSQTNLDGKIIRATVPSNYMTKNGYEDGKTKRVCFATSVDGCLRGLSLKCEGMKLFVHVPDGNYNIYKPSNKEVPDASITGEVWIKKAVKMKCIGQIYVIGDKGEDGIPYKYGDKTAELYDWEWKWIDKFNESSSILPQDTGITTVIFDIGDVLVSANIKDYLIADPEVPNEIVDELLKLWFIDKDEVDDTMDLDTYREIVNKRMGVEFSKYIPKLFQYNVDCVTAFDYTIPMIQDLKDKGYKVYYLSNWSAWTHDLLQEAGKFDFLKLMDGGVFSYDAGYMKPDEEIYKILLNKYKINPEEALFFDDREENIEAANKLGIHGIHFPKHDVSIVYNNLYGRKLAKAIYEDMDNIRYDFDQSYNDKVFGFPSIQESKTNKKPLYFYHMVNSDANLSKGLLSLGYMYHHDKSLFLKNASKYRDRLCDGWGIYPGRDPRSLTAEEIYEGIKKHRKEDNLNTIYFFKYPPYSTLDKRFDRLYKYKKLYRININDPKMKSIIKNIYYGWVDSNTDNDPLDRKYYETISPEDYFNNFDPDKGLLFSTLYHISIEVKNGYIPMKLLEEVKIPNTVEDIISIEESSIQEYGTTGGTIVGSNQPDSVYIVNYMQNNVFSGYKEPKRAICKKGMNQMYTTNSGKAIPVDIDKFKEEASNISVFRFKGTPVLSYDQIIENASTDNDFYLLLTGDTLEAYGTLEYDNRFIQEENFFDELSDITFCTESTITSQIE